MNIVYLSNEYPKSNMTSGGIGTFIKSISKWLDYQFVNVTILGINDDATYEEIKEDNLRIIRLPLIKKKGYTWIINYKQINRKLKEMNEYKKIDIIEGSEMSFSFIKKLNGPKYLLRMHGGHHFFSEFENRKIDLWKGYQEKKSFKNADYVIGVSKFVVEHTAKYISFKNKLKGVIFNPANLDKFYKSNPEKIKQGRILYIGTVCEKKGIRQLIQAFPSIKERIPNAHLHIYGKDWYFPKTQKSYITYVKNFIDPRYTKDIVFFPPVPNDEIPAIIEKSEICCFPSHMEAMPLSWIEAMSCGKPLVASEKGPGPEIIKNLKNGLLCNPLNPNDIANKVISVLSDKKLQKMIGNNAYEYAKNNFDINKIGKMNLDLYKSLL